MPCEQDELGFPCINSSVLRVVTPSGLTSAAIYCVISDFLHECDTCSPRGWFSQRPLFRGTATRLLTIPVSKQPGAGEIHRAALDKKRCVGAPPQVALMRLRISVSSDF